MKLDGKIALVTGAARGIGAGCAIELAKAGCHVAINDIRPTTEAQATLDAIRAQGRRAHFAQGDAFDRASCEQVVESSTSALGPIDILVSNPAFNIRAPFLEARPEDFERVVRGTLLGGFHMSQIVAQRMVARKSPGKIVFISSVHARIPLGRSAAYNAGKYGLNGLAFTIANELTPYRINVNVIEPGWIDTPGERASFTDEALAEAAATLPWGRLGRPDDIGKAVVFLSSADADYITGASLVVDGGYWFKDAKE